jgi:NADP-dependent 3-hydroxy acid dehydrogenase YdfG
VAAPLIVITGATHGIGRALALAFARDGHPLLLVARHAETVAELANRPHRFAEADVTDLRAPAGGDCCGREGVRADRLSR